MRGRRATARLSQPRLHATGMEQDEGQLTREQRNRSMKYSTADGMGYSMMAGLGDAFMPAAIIALGAGSFWIGMLAALPQLLGAALQFVSLNVLRVVKNRKTVVVLGSLLQALAWLPIIALLLWPGPLSVPLIIVFFSLGAGISLMVNPVWSSWISDIVPENERAGFFANRNKLMQIVLFVTVFVAGMILHDLQLGYPAGVAFAAVFAIAFFSRLSTVLFHMRTENVNYEIQLVREIKLKHLFLLPAHRNELWFLAFVALMNFSVQFGSPFFTPYMLSELHFDIGFLGIVTALAILAKVIAYPYWAKAIDRFGNRAVLVATAFTLPIYPLLWLFSKDPYMIILFNVFSGLTWSGFDLSVFNYALSLVGRELRPSFISKYNAFAGFFYAAGSLCGGLFLAGFGGGNMALFGISGMLLVFLLSAVLRMATILFFAPHLSTGKDIENKMDDRAMVFKLVAVDPTKGAVNQVADGWNFTRKVVAKEAAIGGWAFRAGIGATGDLIKEGGRKIASKISRRNRL